MTTKLSKLAAQVLPLLLVLGCNSGITPKYFLENVVSTNYGLSLPKSSKLLNFVDSVDGSVLGFSRSNARYAKVRIDASDFVDLDQQITKKHGNMLSVTLVRQNRDDLEWWDKTDCDVCYYKKIIGIRGGMALHVYLVRQGTNALVLLEDIPGER